MVKDPLFWEYSIWIYNKCNGNGNLANDEIYPDCRIKKLKPLRTIIGNIR